MNKSLKEDRLEKLVVMNSTILIRDELTSRNFTFIETCGIFKIIIKKMVLFIQIDYDCALCWTNITNDKSFNLCNYGLNVKEFITKLDGIIKDLDKLYKLKLEVDIHINEIKKQINSSDIYGLEFDYYNIDELLFENIIHTENN